MKQTVYAAVAALIAMFATSGIVALATASPRPAPGISPAEVELVAHLDEIIARQLVDAKVRLGAALPR